MKNLRTFAAGWIGRALLFGSVLAMPRLAVAQGTERPSGARTEGVVVHGHWTIEVRNADGSLAERHEFDNSLTPYGGAAISAMLTLGIQTGFWSVHLLGTTGSGVQPGCDMHPCILVQTGAANVPSDGNTLPNSLAATASSEVVLTGSMTVATGGAIRSVATGAGGCGPNAFNPNFAGECLEWQNGFYMTGRTLPNAITVSAGQIVTVVVRLSFSST